MCKGGGVIVFDELNDADYPGESIALKELADINKIRVEQSDILPDRTYWIIE